jgi:hypothetical protein
VLTDPLATSAFEMHKAEDEVSSGFDLGACLMADAECIASVLDHGQEANCPESQAFLKMVHVTASQVSIRADKQRLSRKSAGAEKVDIASLATTHYLSLYEATKTSSGKAAQ